MPTVLITAFEPYDRWPTNSSWLALMELTHELPSEPKLVTRRYPVDFVEARERLKKDLQANYDYAIFLGQAPGSGRVHLESIAVNVGGTSRQLPDEFVPLVADGPAAYRTGLPLGEWSQTLRNIGIPAQVSFHAGTYLCNAIFYLGQHFVAEQGLKTQCVFIHLPLAPSQVTADRQDLPSLPSPIAAAALRLVLGELVAREDDAKV
jgi:pyroglutamyl-peptidase